MLGKLGNRIAAEGILHRMRCSKARSLRSALHVVIAIIWGITILHKKTHIHLTRTLRTIITLNLILQRSLVAGLHIKIPYPHVICRSDGKTHKICPHTRYIPAVGNTITQPARIPVNKKLTLYPVGIILRVSQTPQLRKVPECPPDSISIIMLIERNTILIQRNLSHTPIILRVSTIHITRHTPSKKCVIETCIKLGHIFIRTTLNHYSSKVVVPHIHSTLPGLVKREILRLTLQV